MRKRNFITSYKKRDFLINIVMIIGILICLIFLNKLFPKSLFIMVVFLFLILVFGTLGVIFINDNKNRFNFEIEYYQFIIGGLFVGILAGVISEPTLLNSLFYPLVILLILLGIIFIIKFKINDKKK